MASRMLRMFGLLGLVSIFTACAEEPSSPEEYLADTQSAVGTCPLDELTWPAGTSDDAKTCAGPWEYHEHCNEENPRCGVDHCEEQSCTPRRVPGFWSVAVETSHPTTENCHGGHTPDCTVDHHADLCTTDKNNAVAARRSWVPAEFQFEVYGTVTADTSHSDTDYCHITVFLPNTQNDCTCVRWKYLACDLEPRYCSGNPPLPSRYSPPGMTRAQIAASYGDDGPTCLTCEDVVDPTQKFDCLKRHWDELSGRDGGFEGQQPASGAFSMSPTLQLPWTQSGGVVASSGSQIDGVNYAFMWPITDSAVAELKQAVPVTPGRTYNVGAYVQTSTDGATWRVLGARRSGDGWATSGTWFNDTPSYQWQQLSFVAPDGGSADISVTEYASSAFGGWTAVDDISIWPADGPLGDDIRLAFLRKFQLLFRLESTSLDNTRLATLRYLAFQQQGALDHKLGCGDTVGPPVPTCSADDASYYAYSLQSLEECSLLLAPDVPRDVVSRELRQCIWAYSGLANEWLIGTDRDNQCGGPAMRAYANDLIEKLLQRQYDVMSTAPADLGAFTRQLELVNEWFAVADRERTLRDALDATGKDAREEALVNDLSWQLRGLWDAAYRKTNPFATLQASLRGSPDAEAINRELKDLIGQGFALDQQLVTAAFTPVDGTVDPDGTYVYGPTPISGWPLVMLLGDALTAVSQRVDGLSVFHDFACVFRKGCGTLLVDTPVARTWQLLASLTSRDELNATLATSLALSGWKNTFGRIRDQYDAFAQSLPAGGLLAGDVSTLPRAVRPLARIVRTAQARRTAFAQTGQFEPTMRNELKAGVDVQAREHIIQDVRAEMVGLVAAGSAYNQSVVSFVQSLIAMVDTQSSDDHMQSELTRLADRRDILTGDFDALARQGMAEAKAFGDIESRFQSIQANLDSGATFQHGPQTDLYFSAFSANYHRSGHQDNLAGWSAGQVTGVQKGQMLEVFAENRYRATCALRSHAYLQAIGGDGTSVPDDALIGPEGAELAWNGSAYHTHAVADTQSSSTSVGLSAEVCVTGSTPLSQVFGVTAKACASIKHDWTWSHSENEGDNSSAGTSARFAAGLRLPGTPFPDMPAGALVVVFVKADGHVAEAHVVNTGHNVFVAPDPAGDTTTTAYFIVNDRGDCANADQSAQVHLGVRVMRDAATAAKTTLAKMAEALGKMRALEAATISQGRILPSQAAATRSEALALVDTLTGPDYPVQVHRLYDAFVDKEILRVEREVEMIQVRREIHDLELQMETLHKDSINGVDRSRLQALTARWALRNLDTERLRARTFATMRNVRAYFLPILELWYPSVLDSFSSQGSLDDLLVRAELDSSMGELITRSSNVLGTLNLIFGNAQYGQRSQGAQYKVVAVDFPNPRYQGMRSPTFGKYPFGEQTQAYALWEGIMARRSTQITIRPDDLYGDTSDAALACAQANPVIQKMALYVVRPGDPDFVTLNGLPRNFDSWSSDQQVFAQASGPEIFTITDGTWEYNPLPIVYGEFDDAARNVLGDQDLAAQPPVGLSPFETFQVDFSKIAAIESGATPGKSGFDNDASDLVVVMQVDWKPAAPALTWAGVCRPHH
jgi:hypothetical protein